MNAGDVTGPGNTGDELGAANASTSVTDNPGSPTVDGARNAVAGADSNCNFVPVKKEEDAVETEEIDVPPCPAFKLPRCPVCDCSFDTDVTLRQRNYSDMRNQHHLPVSCHKCSQVECYNCVATRMANKWDITNDVSRKVKHLPCSLCGDPCGHYLDMEPMTVSPESFNALARDDAVATARVATGNRGNANGANANRANANRRTRRRTQTAQRAAAAAAAAAVSAAASSAASSQKAKKDEAVKRPDRLLVCLPLVNVIREINEYLPVINDAFKAATGRSLFASPDNAPTPSNFVANAQPSPAPSPQGAAHAQSPGNSSIGPSFDGEDDERPDEARKRPYITSPAVQAAATDRTQADHRMSRARRTPTRLVEELAAEEQVRGLNRLMAAAASAAEFADVTEDSGRGNRDAANAVSPRRSPSPYSSPPARTTTARSPVRRQSGKDSRPRSGRRSTDVEVASSAGGRTGGDVLDTLIDDASQPQILVEGSLRSYAKVRTRLEQGRCRWESQRGPGASVAVFRTEEDAFDTWKKAARAIKHGPLKLRLHLPNDVRGAQELPKWFPSESVVGMKVRKFFPDYDEPFDGRIIRYLGQRDDSDDDSEDEENAELWEVLFEDGDVEHWNRNEVAFNRQMFVSYLLQTRRAARANEAVEHREDENASQALPSDESQRFSPAPDEARSSSEASVAAILEITTSPSTHSHAPDTTPTLSNRSPTRDPSAASEPVENAASTPHRDSPRPSRPSDQDPHFGTPPSRTHQSMPAAAPANHPNRSTARDMTHLRSSESSSSSRLGEGAPGRQQPQAISPAKRARNPAPPPLPPPSARTHGTADADGGYVPWQGKKGKRKAEARAWKASVVKAKKAKSSDESPAQAPVIIAGGLYGELDYVTVRDSRRGGEQGGGTPP